MLDVTLNLYTKHAVSLSGVALSFSSIHTIRNGQPGFADILALFTDGKLLSTLYTSSTQKYEVDS